MITFDQVSVRFGDTQALKGLNLTFARGKTSVLIGQSGCGKSTILRLITGLCQPTSGRVSLDGQPIVPENIQTIRRLLGYVIQDGGLFPHLTGRQNVALMAAQNGWDQDAIDQKIASLADLTHLPTEALDRFPSQLSGGQKQRLSLMRALILDPEILLLDEPLGALDPLIRHDLQRELKDIFQTLGKTVVLVTHDMGEAAFFGDQIWLLDQGEIIQDGSVETFLNQPANDFVRRFLSAQRSPYDVATPTP